jgi:hypothetical protein
MINMAKRYVWQSVFAWSMFAFAWPVAAQPNEFSFGVIAHPFKASSDESILRDAISKTDADNLAFVVASGMKSATEPCTDALYKRRKDILNSAKNGLIVSLAGNDWSDCKNTHGKSSAMERLNRLRDLFFVDEFSSGSSRIPVVRQSSTAKFRSYSENARWEVGNVMFATINLPANNNHYRPEAGRNSEFEDRLIANRDWLQRIFTFAARKKRAAIVLFCDGNPLAKPTSSQFFDFGTKRDGFAETRRHINALAAKFPGRVLIIHGQAADKPSAPDSINWRDNLGELDVGSEWIKLTVNPATPTLFSLGNEAVEATNTHK